MSWNFLLLFSYNEQTKKLIKGNPPGKNFWKQEWNSAVAAFKAPNKQFGENGKGLIFNLNNLIVIKTEKKTCLTEDTFMVSQKWFNHQGVPSENVVRKISNGVATTLNDNELLDSFLCKFVLSTCYLIFYNKFSFIFVLFKYFES